jgi:LysR family hydrogen peroxide-inducible transcriptional activator
MSLSSEPTLRQLRYLVALGSTLSFRRAAAICGITQPSFSAQIKALEASLGVVVAERGTGAVTMTPLGRELAAAAVEILDRVDGLKAKAAEGPVAGVLRLGVKATLGPYLLPKVIENLHRTHPELKLFIREGAPVDLEMELSAGLHDMLLAQLPILSGDIASARLFREPLFLAVAGDHPLAGKTSFEPEDLRGLDVLTLSARYHLHEQVLRLCEEHGARLRRDYEGTSLDALRQMVGMGLGVTFLPGLYVASEVRDTADVAVLRSSKLRLSRTMGLAWRKASAIDPARQAITEAVGEVLRGGSEYAILDRS